MLPQQVSKMTANQQNSKLSDGGKAPMVFLWLLGFTGHVAVHCVLPTDTLNRDVKAVNTSLQWICSFRDLLSVSLWATAFRNFLCCLRDKCDTGAVFHEIYRIQCVGEIHIFAYNHVQTYVKLKCWGTCVRESHETVCGVTEAWPDGKTGDGAALDS